MDYNIEIAALNKENKKEKGDILEDLCGKVLECQQYSVDKEVRKEGSEVDLIIKHKVRNEKIYVECKGQKNNISAEILLKLIGNLSFNNMDEGWLFTIANLGKDAKGIKDSYDENPNKKPKISFYLKNEIIDQLISVRKIVDPKLLKNKLNHNLKDKTTLLLTAFKKLWVFEVEENGETVGVIFFDAETGERIISKECVEKIKLTDTDFKEYEVFMNEVKEIKKENFEKTMENVIEISSGDSWTDYRPSQPKYFVGRELEIKRILDLFEDIRQDRSKTRLFAVASQSGLGKSSLMLKLISEAQKKQHKKNFFVYGVDVRAAETGKYIELTLKKAVEKSIKEGFIKIDNDIELGDKYAPFSTKFGIEYIEKLKQEKKVLVILFDQFEEILSKKELENLFKNMYCYCNAIDSIRENIVLGFAWKTDLLIPMDNPAYSLWNNLSDRRVDISLRNFNEKETYQSIRKFYKEAKIEIDKTTEKYIITQSQGYPWLLKKLCIHIEEMKEKNLDKKSLMVGGSLDIDKLFQKELDLLQPKEAECIERIGKESPAECSEIEKIYGINLIEILIKKRLVIRKGSKLILYWDIFRDFVVEKKIPLIFTTYIPQGNLNTIITVAKTCQNKKTIEKISKELGMTIKALGNVISDLVIFGIVDRGENEISFLLENEDEILQKIRNYMKNHIILDEIKENYNNSISDVEFEELFKKIYSGKNLTDGTINVYIKKMRNYFISLKLLTSNGENVSDESIGEILIGDSLERKNHFLGETSYQKVFEYLKNISEGKKVTKTRNVGEVIRKLRICEKDIISEDVEKVIFDALSMDATMKIVEENSSVLDNIVKLGEILEKKYDKCWSLSSKKRIGGAIRRWYKEFESLKKKYSKDE
ncbi:restriction endonuclease [Cetobacterium somerae]